MIASGTTLVRAAEACRKAGATAVHAAATHGLFEGKAEEMLGRAGLDTLIVSDTLPPWRLSADGILRQQLVVLPACRRLADAVDRLHRGLDLSAIDDTASPDGSDA
jgi:ribose-phosphate pyrophosphokinase